MSQICGAILGSMLAMEAAAHGGTPGIVDAARYGARCDGSADDTAAVQSAYDALAKTGGQLQLPVGTCRFNLVVAHSNIAIYGVARSASPTQGGPGGTVIRPADPARPTLQIGDGQAQVNSVTFGHFTVSGVPGAAKSDGIVVRGAYLVNGSDFTVENFGRDNIRIESTEARASFYINLTSFASRWARGAGFRAVWGPKYVSATNLTGFMIQGWPGEGAYALVTDDAPLNLAQGWIQVGGSRKGHVLAKSRTVKTLISAVNVDVDSDSSSEVLVEVEGPRGPVTRYVAGRLHVDGAMRTPGGEVIDARGQ